MAFLKQTHVSGGLFVTGSGNFISASEFRGDLVGTSSWAESASEAVHAVSASALDANADLQVKTLHVSGNAQVDGDLKVLGDLTYVGVQDLRVKDKTIELNVNDSGSAQSSVDGAGILMKGTDTNVELIYSSSDDKLHVNKTIAGTIDSASEAVHAVSASRADSAEVADKVSQSLTLQLTDENGTAAADVVFDGEAAKTFSIDLSALETKTAVSASVADLQDQIDAISGEGGSGSITQRIQEAIEALNGDASAEASGTPVSGGVFVLSGVAINEASGTITSGSATSVEVEKAGEAAKVEARLLGTAADETGSMTLYGVKNYVDAKTGDGVTALSESVATDIANVMLSQSNADTELSESIAAVASSSLNLVESSSWIAVSEKANNKQTISAKTQSVADADASTANGLALAADVKEYVDNQVSDKNVDAVGDDWVSLSATDNAVTASANVKTIAAATSESNGLASAYDVKSHVSSSVAALSSSVEAVDSAQNDRLAALETASGSAITRLDTLEAATSSYLAASDFESYTASQANVDATQSARIADLEASASAITSDYVKKAGDTMSGNLDMGTNGIKFGDATMKWSSAENAIVFEFDED